MKSKLSTRLESLEQCIRIINLPVLHRFDKSQVNARLVSCDSIIRLDGHKTEAVLS